jgi:hypothetical protein
MLITRLHRGKITWRQKWELTNGYAGDMHNNWCA